MAAAVNTTIPAMIATGSTGLPFFDGDSGIGGIGGRIDWD
jgi:hypothetical protein